MFELEAGGGEREALAGAPDPDPVRLVRAAAPTLSVIVALIFSSYALLGTNGLLARSEYRNQLDDSKVQLSKL